MPHASASTVVPATIIAMATNLPINAAGLTDSRIKPRARQLNKVPARNTNNGRVASTAAADDTGPEAEGQDEQEDCQLGQNSFADHERGQSVRGAQPLPQPPPVGGTSEHGEDGNHPQFLQPEHFPRREVLERKFGQKEGKAQSGRAGHQRRQPRRQPEEPPTETSSEMSAAPQMTRAMASHCAPETVSPRNPSASNATRIG